MWYQSWRASTGAFSPLGNGWWMSFILQNGAGKPKSCFHKSFKDPSAPLCKFHCPLPRNHTESPEIHAYLSNHHPAKRSNFSIPVPWQLVKHFKWLLGYLSRKDDWFRISIRNSGKHETGLEVSGEAKITPQNHPPKRSRKYLDVLGLGSFSTEPRRAIHLENFNPYSSRM